MTGESSPIADRELARRAAPVLDLPPRTARLLIVAGAVGVVLILVQSLVGNQTETIGVDKIIHFTGYALLAAVLVLGLPPRLYIPALLGVVGLSYAIELLQPLNMRSFDTGDAIANTLGVAIGAALGLGLRVGYGFLRTELDAARIRRNLIVLPPSTVIVSEGEVIDQFYIIKGGTVSILRTVDGREVEITRLGPGEMFGLLAEIQRTPQVATARALTEVKLYQVDYDELIANVGGRDQPLGVVLAYLANELRVATDAVTALRLRPGERPEP